MKNLRVPILCLLKSGSGVIQIQRQLNRNDFDVKRMTINNSNNGHGKEVKSVISNKKNTCFMGDIPRATPDMVRKIRTMILKANQSTKRDITNK